MFCPFCGNTIVENAAFCMSCGQQIPTAGGAPTPTAQAPVQAPVQPPVQVAVQPAFAPAAPNITVNVKKGRSGWIKWVVMLGVLAVAAVVTVVALNLFLVSDEDKIRDRIDEFEVACNNADMEGMFNCFDKQTRKSYETMMSMAEGLFGGLTGYDLPLGDMLQLGGMEMAGQYTMDIEILSDIVIEGDSAYVDVRLVMDGEGEDGTFVLCKEGSDWYLDYEGISGESFAASFY